jgi:hypothetical protein
MATCPHCKGHLTDAHRCARHPVKRAIETTLAALVGGIAGLVLISIVDPRGQTAIEGVSVICGALASAGLYRFIRR